ncbi:MAG: hypothetical protein ACRENE_10760, partial [Polyangiaceae bacterium]
PEDGSVEAATNPAANPAANAAANTTDASPVDTDGSDDDGADDVATVSAADAASDTMADTAIGLDTTADAMPDVTVGEMPDAGVAPSPDAPFAADAPTAAMPETGPDAGSDATNDAAYDASTDVAEAGEAAVADASLDGMPEASGYSEATDGSFSSDSAAPTLVTVGVGSNLITGVVGGGSADGQFDDYFEITVPARAALTSILLITDESSSGPADLTFFAVARGTSISSSDSTAAGMLGWVLFDASMVDMNLLPAMGQAGNGASGFTPPLGPGTYTFRVQDDDGSNLVNYQFRFVLSAE